MAVEKSHYPLLCAICASLFTTPLMAAGVNAVLPEMGAGLNAGAAELSLVGAIYSLGLAIFQLSSGSLGDIWGHRRVFIFGAAIFCLASLGAGFMTRINPLLCFRFAQGIGGAMLSAAGLALLASAAAPENRAAYLGLSGAAVYSGIACGPPVAGFVTGAVGWRWLFFGNAATSLIVFCLMAFAARNEWRPAKDQPFDWQGCVWYALAMACLTGGAAELGASPGLAWTAFGGFAVFLAIFCLRQTRSAFPILDLALLTRNRVLTLSCIAAFVNYASFFGVIFYFSFYIQIGHRTSVQTTGLILAFQPFMQALATPVAARLCKIWPQGRAAALGAAVCGFGLLASALLAPDTPLWPLFVAQGLLGSGMSLFSLANTAIILESAGQRHIGQASALTGAVRTAGQLISMALITLSLSLFLGREAVSAATFAGFMESMRVNLTVFGSLNLLAVGMCLARNRAVKKSK